MAVTQLIPMGQPVTLLAGQVYALPAVAVTIFTDLGAAALTISNTLAFTNSVAVVLTAGAAKVVGGWIKAAADTVVIAKRD